MSQPRRSRSTRKSAGSSRARATRTSMLTGTTKGDAAHRPLVEVKKDYRYRGKNKRDELTPLQQAVLGALGKVPLTPQAIAKAVAGKHSGVYGALMALKERGLASKDQQKWTRA